MKVLVTGGAGFIGSHVVEQLIAQKHQPIVLDNFSTGKKINLSPGVKCYRADIKDQKIGQIFNKEKIETICHLAAATNVRKSIEDPLNDVSNNVLGLVNLLENAKKHRIKRFVFSSTGGALYGNAKILLFNLLAKRLRVNIKAKQGPQIEGEIKKSCLNCGKARQELDWRPEYSLEQGANKTIAYFNNLPYS